MAEKIETTRWDVVENLKSPEQTMAYIDAALEYGDPEIVMASIGDVIRARGMRNPVNNTGLYKI